MSPADGSRQPKVPIDSGQYLIGQLALWRGDCRTMPSAPLKEEDSFLTHS